MPKEVFSHTAVTPTPLEEVWARLDEPPTWEAIGGVDRVIDPVVDPDGSLHGFSFEVTAAGRAYLGKATPLKRDEPTLMAWNIDTPEVMGSTSVALSEVEDGTAITVTLEVESKGLLSTMFFPVIAATIGTGLPKSVDAFASGLKDPA